jgi:hypothetical protein
MQHGVRVLSYYGIVVRFKDYLALSLMNFDDERDFIHSVFPIFFPLLEVVCAKWLPIYLAWRLISRAKMNELRRPD